MGRYAKDTTVTEDRSRAEVERTLQRYGATQFVSGWDKGEGGEPDRSFLYFKYQGVQYSLKVPMPAREDFRLTPSGRYERYPEQIDAEWGKAQRQRWRSVVLYIKAVLEAVDAGIVTMEQAMLGSMLLPNKQTVYEWAKPHVPHLTTRMPQSLPGLPAPREGGDDDAVDGEWREA